MSLEEYKGVYVFAQQVDGEVSGIAYELLGKAKDLAKDLNTDVTAVLIGYNVKGLVDGLAQYGADKVIVVDDKELEVYRTEPYTHALASVINEYKPEIVLEAQQIGVSGYAFAIDETTGLILGNREQEDWNGQTVDDVDDIIIDTVKDITANETYGEVTSAGKYFISANKIPNTNFVTVVVVPKQDVTTRAAGIKNASFITMAVGIVIQVIVILVVLTLLMRPVPKIDKAINQIKDLDFTTACAVKSSDELGRT